MAADVFTTELLGTESIQPEQVFRMFSLGQPVSAQNIDLKDVVCLV